MGFQLYRHGPVLGIAASGFLCAALLGGCSSSSATSHGSPAGTFATHYAAALRALDTGDNELAATELKRAIQRNPQHPFPHFYLGVLYADQGDDELAMVAFKRAIALEPHFPEALFNLGTLLLERRETVQAVEVLEQAIDHDPDYVPAYNNLAKAYFMAGQPVIAGAAYEEALARDPDNAVALNGLATLARGAGAVEAESLYRSRLAGEKGMLDAGSEGGS